MGDEIRLVAQHPVQHDREFAGQRDGGLAQASAPGDAERPGLQIRAPDGPGQNDVGRTDADSNPNYGFTLLSPG